jgi:two-component system nitrogen regulation response regulator NtrX
MSNAHILVVDDEPDIRAVVKDILEDEGFEVSLAENAEEARRARRDRRPDLILLDIWMPDTDGISLLKEWSQGEDLAVPVIMISGHGTVETAVEATRLGAYDFIEKPLSLAKLLVTIERALEASSLRRENVDLRRRHGAQETVPIGNSSIMRALREQVERIANHNTTVFITGESGSGKEAFARYLHSCSKRADGSFVDVRVAGLAKENPALELFGSEEGGELHFGSLDRADGGTLFLKDIADLDLNVQARLLSALETKSFLRVGGREPVVVDVRVVAATHHDLLGRVNAGQFRDDLYYHLNVVPLRIPPLREHFEDLPELLDYYVEQLASKEGLPRRHFTLAAQTRLRHYQWPGNLRELRNLVQRLLILGTGEDIGSPEVDQALGIGAAQSGAMNIPGLDKPLREAREDFERAYLEYQLLEANGSVSKVAERIGVERTHLYRKMRGLGINPKDIKQKKPARG